MLSLVSALFSVVGCCALSNLRVNVPPTTLLTAVCYQWHTDELPLSNYVVSATRLSSGQVRLHSFTSIVVIRLGEMTDTTIDLMTASNLAAYLPQINPRAFPLHQPARFNVMFEKVFITKYYSRKIPLV